MKWAGGSRAESGVSGWANLTKNHPEVESRFESASIRERILVTRPKRSSVLLAAASFLRMPSSSAACNCCSWSFHCNRTARFCSAVSSLDSLNASGVAKTLAGLFIALSMSIAAYDSAVATLGASSQRGACRGVFVPVNTAQPAAILKSGHSNLSQTRKRYDGRGGLAVPFESITPFSPSMTRAGVARRLRRSSIIDGCAAAWGAGTGQSRPQHSKAPS
jgi:hypothetical protein